MPKYKDNHSDESDVDELAQTIDNEFGVTIMRTLVVKKEFTTTNQKTLSLHLRKEPSHPIWLQR